MDQTSYINTDPLITQQDVAELNRKMAKRAMRNMLIVFGIKWGVIFLVNRWARNASK
jgi:hypothetical protein